MYGLVGKAFPNLAYECSQAVRLRIVVKETADLGIVSQYALRLCEIGNGVQDDIILRGQSGALRIVPHTDGRREVIRKPSKR